MSMAARTMEARRAREGGFSFIRLMLFLAVLGTGFWAAYKVLPVYNTYWKVQDVFESAARNLTDKSAAEIRARLPDLFFVKYLHKQDLPDEFYDNLRIRNRDGRVSLSSSYHVTVWLLAPVESVDPDADYDPDELRGMDRLRDALRLDFDFEPHAETP